MASQNTTQLLRLGPFKGLDATTAGPYIEAGRASGASNVDIRRNSGAFSTFRGRVNLTSFTASPNSEIVALAELGVSESIRYILASLSSGEVSWYQPESRDGAVLGNGQPFSQAVQYGPSLFTNAGQQIALGRNGMTAMQWQYQISDTGFEPTVASNSHNAIKMVHQTYSYLFTIAVQLPTRTYAPDEYGQESTPTGVAIGQSGAAVYEFQVAIADDNHDILITGNNTNTWGGMLVDGSTWGVNVYRLSAAQPIPYLVASYFWAAGDAWGQLVNGTAYEDSATDQSIAANKQCLFNQDVPPISPNNLGAVFAHKERTWVFTIVQDADTFNQPQSQLWYSSYGLPWQFDAANQVLLVGNDGTPDFQSGSLPLFGDVPVNGVSLSSVGVLFKSKSLWILYGDDENDFIVRKVGQYGCIAPASVVVCQGIVYWLTEEGVFAFDGANAPQYISEHIRGQLNALPITDWRAACGWFADRTYYLSVPHVVSTAPITFVGRVSTSNTGSPSVNVSASGQRQKTVQNAMSPSVTIACTGTVHKPTPDPDTWFTIYLCHLQGQPVVAQWPVSVSVAPVDASTQLGFIANSLSGYPKVTLTLLNPSGTVVATFKDIGANIEYDYSAAGAPTGTWTWQAAIDSAGLAPGGNGDDNSGVYSATVTPTTIQSIPAGSGATSDGARTTLKTRGAMAPVGTGQELTLVLSAVTTPADANGTTSYSVQLADPNGNIVQSWSGITADTTLTYVNPNAIDGDYTWSVWATVTSPGPASETYTCSCTITATWSESGTKTTYSQGVTFAYHLPTQEWMTLPYSTNAVSALPGESAPVPSILRLNEVLAARLGTPLLDSWEAAEMDLGDPTVGTWTGPVSDSGSPGVEKSYELVVLNAPVQNVTAIVTLTIDPNAPGPPTKKFTWNVDLSKGPTSVWMVPNDANGQTSNRGFLAQLSVQAQTPPNSAGPAIIYSVAVYGEPQSNMVPLANGAVQ